MGWRLKSAFSCFEFKTLSKKNLLMTQIDDSILSQVGVGVLVIGKLPNFSSLSLKSISDIGTRRVCYIADENGTNWIENQGLHFPKLQLCRHNSSRIALEIKSLGDEGSYVEFGQKKFFLLMILKWLLILDMWKQHEELNFVLFSDLDVAWRKNINLKHLSTLDEARVLAIQDDSPDKNRIYYCPGIMLWKKSPISEKLIRDVYDYQRSEILQGNVFPDDKALNLYLNKESLHHLVTSLDSTEFVIGHRFPFLMAGILYLARFLVWRFISSRI